MATIALFHPRLGMRPGIEDAAALTLPAGVTLVGDPEAVIANITREAAEEAAEAAAPEEVVAEAAAAAESFVRGKPASDRISLVTFGDRAVQQGPFSTATIDADNVLRTLSVSAPSGVNLLVTAEMKTRSG